METYPRNNRSYTNLHNSNLNSKREVSPRRYNGQTYNGNSNMNYNNPALNKTTTSVHSEHLWNSVQELELFPLELSQLLRNEDRNITLFKGRIQREKSKVGVDIDSFKKELMHYIDDFKLSVMAQLDSIYKVYMERYAKLKGQILQIKRMRDQIEFEISSKGTNLGGNFKHLSTSNINTVRSIENGLKDMKKYHILNYISELQKGKIAPITEDAKDLIILTEYENGFYQHKDLCRLLTDSKENIKGNLRGLYDNKYDFVRDIENVVGKERVTRGMLDQLEEAKVHYKPERDREPRRDIQRDKDLEAENQRALRDKAQRERELFQRERQRDRERDLDRERDMERQRELERQRDQHRQRENSRKGIQRQAMPIAPSKQLAVYEWLQNPRISHEFSIKPNSSDIILCALILPNDQIVIGGKDGLLNVYRIGSGEKVCTLKGHQASICSLALIQAQGIEYLASGSDHGCSCILMWELSTMIMRHRLEGHKAAVTAIVDLLDGQSMVSGSYDKKINIYNLKTGKVSYNLPTNKSSVTGIVLNSTATKMISCGLDNSLSVWQIVRTQHSNNAVETLFLERIIQNNAMICSLVGSMMHQDIVYIGTKDGKVRTVDIEKGQSFKSVTCCNNAVIEMVVLQRQSHPGNPIIVAWPCKQENFKVINTENGKITTIPSKGHIEFGCGIGPKGLLISRNGRGYIAMLSQSETRREVNFYQIQNGNN